MEEWVALRASESAEGGCLSESGKNRSDIAAFGLGHSNSFGNKFGGTVSALEFGGKAIGVGARNFAVDEDDQVDFKGDFCETGVKAICSGDGTEETAALEDAADGSLTDAAGRTNEMARIGIGNGPEDVSGVAIAASSGSNLPARGVGHYPLEAPSGDWFFGAIFQNEGN